MEGIAYVHSAIERKNDGSVVSSIYFEENTETVGVGIIDFTGTLNGRVVKEGELIVSGSTPKGVYFNIDDRGNLIVVGNNADRYDIDEDGNLVYT